MPLNTGSRMACKWELFLSYMPLLFHMGSLTAQEQFQLPTLYMESGDIGVGELVTKDPTSTVAKKVKLNRDMSKEEHEAP